jgi:two-component system, LytTR family, sensor histidine kinase AlgZ
MHPIFRNKALFAAYLVTCAILGGLLAVLVHGPGGGLNWREALIISEPLFILYAFVCLTPWYVCQQLPLASADKLKLAAYHGGTAVLATALWIALARVISYALKTGNRLDPVIPELIAIGFLLYLLSVALHYVLLALEASRSAAIEARDAELRALKAQINPHFLFNSLNSINALTMSDPARAREMCLRLADFLRSTLGLGEKESVEWHEELKLAQAYLDIEQIRYGSRLQVQLEVDNICKNCLVPPLLLQPLIENAVKHGIATLIDGGTIRVESRVQDGRFRLAVENNFDPQAPPPRRRGLGLRNVRQRLETRFGPLASMKARAEGDRFLVEISMPCHVGESL